MEHKETPRHQSQYLLVFITLSVESSIIPIRDALFEHRLYLPMFGFALLAAWLPFRFLPKRRALAVFVCVSIVISLGTATCLRNRVWQDDLIMWSDVVAKSPQNSRAYMNLGTALFKKGRLEEAFSCFSGMLRAEPENARVNYNLGAVLEKQGHIDEAIRHYSEAVRIKPGYAKAHYNLGFIFAGQGHIDEAIRHYSEAVWIRPNYVKARVNLGVVLVRKGDLDRAIIHLSEALRIDPKNVKAHYNLGSVFAGQGRIDEAIRHYSEAVRIRPGHAKTRYNLGNLLAGQGRLDEAIHHLSEAARLRPEDNVPVCYNIACAYARQKKTEESIAWLKKAVDGGFNSWDLLRNDKDLENIRDTSYYRTIIGGREKGDWKR